MGARLEYLSATITAYQDAVHAKDTERAGELAAELRAHGIDPSKILTD